MALAGLALLASSRDAAATPTVAFKLSAVPIPGFPHTGNIVGAGADATLELVIKGTEYFGSPPPVIGANFYPPKGSVVHQAGFPTCAEAVLLSIGPRGCPKSSRAGAGGTVLGFVTFAGERVNETAELLPFFRPGGGLEYFVEGHAPVAVEALATGRFGHLDGIDGYSFEEEEQVPLVESVPEAPYASVDTIKGRFGAAISSHGKTIYYFKIPKTCPKGGFPVKTEVIFAEDGDPSKREPVAANYKAPCPRR